MEFIGIIPARYGSTRFPGKPLAILGDCTVIEHVYRQASKALNRVVVATDDMRILQAVENFGGEAVMTSSTHRSGTDRCREAYEKCDSTADVVINIQGDEPFIAPEQIMQLKSCFDIDGTQIATLVRPFPQNGKYSDLENPNSPKVVINHNNRAMLFSRSVIPYLRGSERDEWPKLHQYFTHIGMYAYLSSTLKEITLLPSSSLEIAESLEQLRWLQNGYNIGVAISEFTTIGIDTPDDLEKARVILNTLHK